jgi:hypothetical protein
VFVKIVTKVNIIYVMDNLALIIYNAFLDHVQMANAYFVMIPKDPIVMANLVNQMIHVLLICVKVHIIVK